MFIDCEFFLLFQVKKKRIRLVQREKKIDVGEVGGRRGNAEDKKKSGIYKPGAKQI